MRLTLAIQIPHWPQLSRIWVCLQDIELAKSLGAEVVELRLDFLKDLDLENPKPQLQQQLDACKQAGLQAIVTFRPAWEG